MYGHTPTWPEKSVPDPAAYPPGSSRTDYRPCAIRFEKGGNWRRFLGHASSCRLFDPLGYYIAPWGYAQLQVLQHAVLATKSLDDDKLADYIRQSTFKTLVGEVKFGTQGEWAESRVLQVQFQHIKGTDLGQFKDLSTQVVVTPTEYKSGGVIYPYEKAK
jgi:hypothetical protein